jgi:hypothetical protein
MTELETYREALERIAADKGPLGGTLTRHDLKAIAQRALDAGKQGDSDDHA